MTQELEGKTRIRALQSQLAQMQSMQAQQLASISNMLDAKLNNIARTSE